MFCFLWTGTTCTLSVVTPGVLPVSLNLIEGAQVVRKEDLRIEVLECLLGLLVMLRGTAMLGGVQYVERFVEREGGVKRVLLR